MTKLLASVRSAEEARLALDGGADFIDLKEPAAGALGRLPDETIRDAVAIVAGRRLVSATIGDRPMVPAEIRAAVRDMAMLGVDIVKIGIFEGEAAATIDALAAEARAGIRLVAVFFADRAPDLRLARRCADAGFLGVMLDTAGKEAGSLRAHLDPLRLRGFVEDIRAQGLLTGLAGALRLADIAALVPLGADYLGFRSALTAGARSAPLSASALGAVRRAIDQASARSSATDTAGAASAASAASSGGTATSSAKSR